MGDAPWMRAGDGRPRRGRIPSGRGAARVGRWAVLAVGLWAALAVPVSPPALAAVEPGIYFDPHSASAGDRITLSSAADYIVCFSEGQEQQARADWPVSLAPAEEASPGAGDLVALGGTWSERDGAVVFAFRVPSLDPGTYRGYVTCPDGHLDPSTTTLRITGVPATDAAPAAIGHGSAVRWLILLALGLGAGGAIVRRLRATGG